MEMCNYLISEGKRKNRSGEKHHSNFKYEMYIPLKRFQKKTLFTSDVSVNWTTVRRWEAKLLDTWQVTQVHLPRQESVAEHEN